MNAHDSIGGVMRGENISTIINEQTALCRVYEAYLHRNRRKNRRLEVLAKPIQLIDITTAQESHLKAIMSTKTEKAGKIVFAQFNKNLAD